MPYAVFSLILPQFTLEEQFRLLKDTGWDGIELRICDIAPEHKDKPYSFWGNHKDPIGPSNLAANVERINRVARTEGVRVCALAPYTNLRQPGDFDAIAAAAADLGVATIRVTAPWRDGKTPFQQLFEEGVAGLERVEQIARARKVKAAVEIHMGTIAPSASGMRRLLEGFDPGAVGAIFDPGNMIHEGYEDWAMALDILGPYLAHVHVKNASWVLTDKPAGGPFVWEPKGSRLREGHANWKAIRAALGRAGYAGWLTLEDFTDQPPKEKLVDALVYLTALAP